MKITPAQKIRNYFNTPRWSNLKIKNNKNPLTIFIEAPNFTKLPSEIYLENEVSYNINVEESFDIIINYDNYSYTIPVLSEDVIIDDTPLLPPPKNAIVFVNEDVEINLRLDENPSDELIFINNWDFELKDITLNLTEELKEILEIEKSYFESIKSKETLTTTIYLNKNRNPTYSHYEGYLLVKSPKGTLDTIKFSINFNRESSTDEGDVNEVECEVDEDCGEDGRCIENFCNFVEEENNVSEGFEEEKKSLWWLWTIIILIIGTISFIFVKKKKEITQNFEDYAKNIKK